MGILPKRRHGHPADRVFGVDTDGSNLIHDWKNQMTHAPNFDVARPAWTLLLAATTLVGLSGCAVDHRSMMRPPGSYQTTESNTDAQGTTTERKVNTDVTVDNKGRRRQSTTSETSRDPRGLMNKTTTKKSTTTTEE